MFPILLLIVTLRTLSFINIHVYNVPLYHIITEENIIMTELVKKLWKESELQNANISDFLELMVLVWVFAVSVIAIAPIV